MRILIKQSENTNASYACKLIHTQAENMQLESCSDVFKTKSSALHRAQTKFRKACIQLKLLNRQLTDMNDHYSRAKDDNFSCFRYNPRLKLAVIEGVRNMYYDYAYMKAEDVARLRQDLFGDDLDIVVSDSETDDDFEA